MNRLGKKITDEQKEIVIAMRQTGESYKKCAKAAGISESAARRIVNGDKPKRTEAEETAEQQGKEKFVENAWSIINLGVQLIKDKLTVAAMDFSAIKGIIAEVVKDRDISDSDKNKLVFLLEQEAKKLVVPSLKELSGVVDVMYNKQALMRGKTTENVGFTGDMDIESHAEVAGYVKKE